MAVIRLRNTRRDAERELAAGDREVIRLMEERLIADGALSGEFGVRRETLRRRAAVPHGKWSRRTE
mgnify:CR=1 FL=1